MLHNLSEAASYSVIVTDFRLQKWQYPLDKYVWTGKLVARRRIARYNVYRGPYNTK